MNKNELEILESAITCISTLQDCLFKVNERLEKIESQLTKDYLKIEENKKILKLQSEWK